MGLCGSKHSKIVSDNYREKKSVRHGAGTAAFLEKYECSFADGQILGSGAYSTVYKCVDKETLEECAAKVIKLREMAQDELEALGGRAMASIEIVGVEFTTKAGKHVSYTKPQITILGAVSESVEALLDA